MNPNSLDLSRFRDLLRAELAARQLLEHPEMAFNARVWAQKRGCRR